MSQVVQVPDNIFEVYIDTHYEGLVPMQWDCRMIVGGVDVFARRYYSPAQAFPRGLSDTLVVEDEASARARFLHSFGARLALTMTWPEGA